MNSLPVSVTTLPTTVNKFLSPSFLATSRLMEHVSFPILSSQTGPLNKYPIPWWHVPSSITVLSIILFSPLERADIFLPTFLLAKHAFLLKSCYHHQWRSWSSVISAPPASSSVASASEPLLSATSSVLFLRMTPSPLFARPFGLASTFSTPLRE